MLLLYPHAFQSLIFNEMASRRIKEFGLKLIPGDLVYRNKDDLDEDLEVAEIVQEEELDEETQQIEENKEKCEVNETEVETSESTINTESVFKRKVKALTEEEINSGVYSIFDVVLPLPGHDITYPNNEMDKWYEEALAKYDLSSEKLKHNVKTFSMAGAYRKLLLKPTEMSWEFRSYDSPEETLILSDFEVLKGKTLDDLKGKGCEKAAESQFQALLLDFCLPTAAYATMMLRELLKSDTSAAHQTALELAAMKDSKPNTTESEDSIEKNKAEKRGADVKEDEAEKDNDEDVPAKVPKLSQEEEEQ